MRGLAAIGLVGGGQRQPQAGAVPIQTPEGMTRHLIEDAEVIKAADIKLE